ncbi:MAG: hypothetical protein F2812_09425, partial [Actinobacteria bacterium]|nr:hypothetical protein [Actinomycetota bacterium]
MLVSVDANELQRATLERKKSDELNVIATALGVKPGSRVKKADLVDLILQAAGVTGSRRANVAPAETAVAETAVAETAVAETAVAETVPAETADGNGHQVEASSAESSTSGPPAPRRRSPRSVGWAGDEGGGADEPASLFDSPSAAAARREAAAARHQSAPVNDPPAAAPTAVVLYPDANALPATTPSVDPA